MSKPLTFGSTVRCNHCKGTGIRKGSKAKCTSCSGSGYHEVEMCMHSCGCSQVASQQLVFVCIDCFQLKCESAD